MPPDRDPDVHCPSRRPGNESARSAAEPQLYPVFLKLAGLPVVIVGGGTVAAGKLDGLLDTGAEVTVIAPVIGDAIRARVGAARLHLRLIERGFVDRDLDGVRWVIAAATPEVNRVVAAAAAQRGLFVNAVDDVASATAYLGGVVRRGVAVIAISTSGIAPALAGLLREALEAVLPDDLEHWIAIANAARAGWKRAGTPIAERRPLLLRALARLYRGDQAAEPAPTLAGYADLADPADPAAPARSLEAAS